MSTVCTWFNALHPEVQAAIIGAIATGLAALIGILTVSHQIRSQARQARDAVAEGERRKMKAALYDEILTSSRDLSDAAIELSNQLRMTNLDVTLAARAATLRVQFNTPSARFIRIMQLHETFSSCALRLIFLIESRRIIDPRIIVFRTALSSVLHDARQYMFSDAIAYVMPALPVDAPNGGLFPYDPPSVEAAEILCIHNDQMIESLNYAISYTEDLLTEMQNCLLGDLFGNQINAREPINPDKQVITLSNSDLVEKWFENNTAWGVDIAKAEAAARARFEREEA